MEHEILIRQDVVDMQVLDGRPGVVRQIVYGRGKAEESSRRSVGNERVVDCVNQLVVHLIGLAFLGFYKIAFSSVGSSQKARARAPFRKSRVPAK
jgi:hypothetical protein